MAYTPTVWKNGEFPPIDAEHLNKIEQGIADAVSITPQTLTDEQKAQARGNIDAAPGGFGLGTRTVVSVSDGRDANDLSGCGFFCVDQNTPTSDWWYGYQIEYDVGYKYQRFGRTDNFEIVERKQINNVWGDWEYLNPPMNLGVEYRTTERYLGKPVYTKVVECSFSGAGTTNIPHGIANIDKCVAAHGIALQKDSSYSFSFPYWFTDGSTLTQGISVSINTSSIALNSVTDYSETFSAQVTIKYTKTTD